MTKKEKEKLTQVLKEVLYGAREIFENNNMVDREDYLTGIIGDFSIDKKFATVTLRVAGNSGVIKELKSIGWEKDEEYMGIGDLLYEDEVGQYDRRIVLKKLMKDL